MSTLVLTRRIGQSIFIGSNVKITLSGYNGGQVKVVIDAPRNLLIDREEIRERKEKENGFNPGEVK